MSPLSSPSTSWISNHSIFKAIKHQLFTIVGNSRFTIYPITKNELKSRPWQSTTALLVLVINPRQFKDEDDYLVDAEKVVKEFINGGGLAVVYKLDDLWTSMDIFASEEFESKFFRERLIAKVGKSFFDSMSKVIKFEGDDHGVDTPKATPCYLIAEDSETHFNDVISEKLIKDTNLNSKAKIKFFINPNADAISNDCDEQLTDSRIRVVLSDDLNFVNCPKHIRDEFDFNCYFEHLTSNRFGRNVLYQQVATSSQLVIEQFPDCNGLVVIPGNC